MYMYFYFKAKKIPFWTFTCCQFHQPETLDFHTTSIVWNSLRKDMTLCTCTIFKWVQTISIMVSST